MGFSQLNVTNNKSGYKNSGAIKGLIQYIMTDKRTGEKVRFYGGTYVDYITSGKSRTTDKVCQKTIPEINRTANVPLCPEFSFGCQRPTGSL